MNNEKYLSNLNQIWDLETIKETKTYLKEIKNTYHNLDNKKQKNEYLKRIKEIGYSFYIDDFFSTAENNSNNEYKIFNTKYAIKKLLLNQIIQLNNKNFDYILNDLINLLEPFTETRKTKRISKKDINLVFQIIQNKIPELKNIFQNIDINIFIFNNSHKFLNSLTTLSLDFKHYIIMCFYMKNNIEYKSGKLNPIYVFLHELGHIICLLSTKSKTSIPNSFLQDLNKYITNLTPDDEDALEVFADSFAMAMMYNTSLNIYNPFSTLYPDEFFNDLEKYFKKLIKEINI